MTNLPLIVAQFALEGHPTRTEHWSLAVLHTKDRVDVYEVQGTFDTFHNVPHRLTAFSADPQLRGGCLVGKINADKLEWLTENLRKNPIQLNDRLWDCQVWVMECLRRLKWTQEEGVVIDKTRESEIREELDKEKERWEVADDTIEERLFA